MVPFLQTAATATGCSVLGNKNRMPAKRGLFTIIENKSRGETFADEVLGMGKHSGQAFGMQIDQLFATKLKTAAEGRFG